LGCIIKRLQETDAGFDITPCVNGLIIAGDMITSKRYWINVHFFRRISITMEDTYLIEKGTSIHAIN
jgi:hypothetical protein